MRSSGKVMIDFSIPIHGGPGDGGVYFPVGGIPVSMFWPTASGREAIYELIRTGFCGYKYVYTPGEKPRAQESPHQASRSVG